MATNKSHMKDITEGLATALLKAFDKSDTSIPKVTEKDFTKLEFALMTELSQMMMVLGVSHAQIRDNINRLTKEVLAQAKALEDLKEHVEDHCQALHTLEDDESDTVH